MPLRPSIPPVVWLAIAVCLGCIVGEQISWSLWTDGTAGCWPLVLACIVAGGLAGAWCWPSGRVVSVLVVAGLVAGMAVSLAQGGNWRHEAVCVADCGAREWIGIVEADPLPGTYGVSVRVRLTGGPLDGACVRISWPEECETPDLGRTVQFAAILEELPDEEWARRLARSGICATGSAWRAEVGVWRSGIVGTLLKWRAARLEQMHAIPGVGGDLLEGIVLGDRRRLIGTSAEEDFRILGLTHLVAVSGSHLALACGAVAAIGALLRVPRRPLVVATVLAGAAYALVTGMAYAALRSLMMLAVTGVGQVLGRRGSGIASLAAAVVLVLTLEPWSVYDVGLQLSALAVGGLLLFGALSTVWANYGLSGLRATIADVLAMTYVAQAATVPVIGSVFGVVSLLAPVANAIAGPLVSVALWVGLLGSVVVSLVPALGGFLERMAATVLGATAWLSSIMAQLPGAAVAIRGGPAISVTLLVMSVLVWVFWPLPRSVRVSRFVAACVTLLTVAIAIGPSPGRQTEIVVLDIGQGDAILVRDSGRTMLVDTGPGATVLTDALARYGVRCVDVLVLTHAHDDHTGGIGGLSGTVQVGWAGVPRIGEYTFASEGPFKGVRENLGGEPLVELQAGDSWWVGKIYVEVLWPSGDVSELGANDTSVVLHLTRGEFDAVLTGDIERAAQEGMLSLGNCRMVEVLKVPHHGSTNGLTAEGLEAWSPQDAIISVGEGNDFGHPCQETLDALRDANVRTWRTDLSGDVTVTIKKDGYYVEVAEDGAAAFVHAKMAPVRYCACCSAPDDSFDVREFCGCSSTRGIEACLSNIRRGGAASRSRSPPVAR